MDSDDAGAETRASSRAKIARLLFERGCLNRQFDDIEHDRKALEDFTASIELMPDACAPALMQRSALLGGARLHQPMGAIRDSLEALLQAERFTGCTQLLLRQHHAKLCQRLLGVAHPIAAAAVATASALSTSSLSVQNATAASTTSTSDASPARTSKAVPLSFSAASSFPTNASPSITSITPAIDACDSPPRAFAVAPSASLSSADDDWDLTPKHFTAINSVAPRAADTKAAIVRTARALLPSGRSTPPPPQLHTSALAGSAGSKRKAARSLVGSPIAATTSNVFGFAASASAAATTTAAVGGAAAVLNALGSPRHAHSRSLSASSNGSLASGSTGSSGSGDAAVIDSLDGVQHPIAMFEPRPRKRVRRNPLAPTGAALRRAFAAPTAATTAAAAPVSRVVSSGAVAAAPALTTTATAGDGKPARRALQCFWSEEQLLL